MSVYRRRLPTVLESNLSFNALSAENQQMTLSNMYTQMGRDVDINAVIYRLDNDSVFLEQLQTAFVVSVQRKVDMYMGQALTEAGTNIHGRNSRYA